VKTKGEVGPDGRLRLDVPVELPAGAVELPSPFANSAALKGGATSFIAHLRRGGRPATVERVQIRFR